MSDLSKIEKLEELLKDPEQEQDSLTHFLLGREYLEVDRNEDAVRAFERCVELNPQYSAAYRFLGDAHRKSGNGEKAKETYETGMTIANEMGDLQAAKEMEALTKRI